MSMTNFRAEDMPVKVSIAEDSKPKKDKEPEPQAQEQEQEQPPAEEQSEVPDGTTAEILQWVGDDKERAQQALDKENADESPRKGLTGELEKKLES
jgi:hypothetical protein